MIRFGSVCSGIEAASVAWHPLGWEAAWLSEIEPFPCAVLAHHYPAVPNLGDMTTIADRVLAGEVEAPDVFTGGTPCQAFSVAGKRESLGDARGNLSLTFCEIANAIDDVRAADGREPCVVVWENVPGVLSTKDNAFGCFLGALAGSGCELRSPRNGRWADAGIVLGPRRAIAWRTLDAQYFGLAQRRRRVFVVASARAGFDPAAVLLEFDGVRRDSAPRREEGEGAAGTLKACAGSGGWSNSADHAAAGYMIPALARCVTAGEGKRGDYETTTMVAHTLRAEGFDASEDGTGRGTPLVPVVREVAATLGGRMRGQDDACADNLLVAFSCKDHGADAGDTDTDTTASLTYSQQAAVATGFIPKAPPNSRSMGEAVELAPTINTHQAGQGVQQGMAVRRLTPRECERLQGFQWLCLPTLPGAWQDEAGRWWSPDYTRIPLRNKAGKLNGKFAKDGPRYKALGNSWAVPCAAWIGRRIDAQLRGLA
jgi:DNA (cytosine-5)-methyltransferase 1